MAATDQLVLKADPDSVVVRGESTLTATLTDKDGKPLAEQEITFSLTKADESTEEIGKPKTDQKGTATQKWQAAKIPPGVVSVEAAADGVKSDRVEIRIQTQEEINLANKLRQLSDAKKEQQVKDRDAAQQQKKVEQLQQQLESLKKAAALPTVIQDTVDEYKGVVSGFEQRLADADLTLKQIDESISPKVDKAVRDAILGQRNKVDKDIKDLNAEKDRLQKALDTLVSKLSEAKDQLALKVKNWNDALGTKTGASTAVTSYEDVIKNLQQGADKANGPNDMARVYSTILKIKQGQNDVKGKVPKADALEKSLTTAWQEMNSQTQVVADLEDQKQAKEAEKNENETQLNTLTGDREKTVTDFINVIVPVPPAA